jgi:hypothetical protein
MNGLYVTELEGMVQEPIIQDTIIQDTIVQDTIIQDTMIPNPLSSHNIMENIIIINENNTINQIII